MNQCLQVRFARRIAEGLHVASHGQLIRTNKLVSLNEPEESKLGIFSYLAGIFQLMNFYWHSTCPARFCTSHVGELLLDDTTRTGALTLRDKYSIGYGVTASPRPSRVGVESTGADARRSIF